MAHQCSREGVARHCVNVWRASVVKNVWRASVEKVYVVERCGAPVW